jgi:hypothetical protein
MTPVAGYAVPYLPQYGYDPLISPDYGGWWQRGMAIVKAGWPQLASLQAIGIAVGMLVQAPLLIYIALWSQSLLSDANGGATGQPDLGPILGTAGLALLAAFVSVIISAAITVATMHLAASIAAGTTRSVGASARLALRRALPLVGWEVLSAPIILAALCLCVLPVLYPLAVFTILPAVVAFERTNAISRCFALFHRNVGVAVGRIATIAGIGILVAVVASIIGQIVESAAGVPGSIGVPVGGRDVETGVLIAATIGSTAVSVVLTAAVAVLTGPLTLLTYADLRARYEPLSTQVLINELGIDETTTDPYAPHPPPLNTPPPIRVDQGSLGCLPGSR